MPLRWQALPQCRREEWAIGQPLTPPPSTKPPHPSTNPIHPMPATQLQRLERGQAQAVSDSDIRPGTSTSATWARSGSSSQWLGYPARHLNFSDLSEVRLKQSVTRISGPAPQLQRLERGQAQETRISGPSNPGRAACPCTNELY